MGDGRVLLVTLVGRLARQHQSGWRELSPAEALRELGLVANPGTYAIEDLYSADSLEERIYRLRCVEGWSMVIPWVGFPLADIISRADPGGSAKYVAFETLVRGYARELAWSLVDDFGDARRAIYGQRLWPACHPGIQIEFRKRRNVVGVKVGQEDRLEAL